MQFVFLTAQFFLVDHSLLLHVVLLTDAVAVHDVLYCRFLKKKLNTSRHSEHPGGIIG